MPSFELILTPEQNGIPAELIELTPRAINSDKLGADLLTALGNLVVGVSTRGGCIALLLSGIPSTQQQSVAETIIAAHNPAALTPEQQTQAGNAVRRDTTKTQFATLTAGLAGLSIEDRSYVITARIMAFKDGAGLPAIAAIADKAAAISYVTAKPEWTNATVATRALVGDVLETMAGVVQAVMLILE